MEVRDLPIGRLREAPWNPNALDDAGMTRLSGSLRRFGLVQNLVVRPHGDDFEVLGGNQRLQILRESGVARVPCVVVELDDAHARLLAQALNRLHGREDIGLRAEVVRYMLRDLSVDEVLAVLPESAQSLAELSQLGTEDMARHLRQWEVAQVARPRHLVFHLSGEHALIVERALGRAAAVSGTNEQGLPKKTAALVRICREYGARHGDGEVGTQ